MELKRTALALGLLAGLPLAAGAQDLSYTYLEVDYVNADIGDIDRGDGFLDEIDDGDGYALRGSLSFTDNFFIFGDYSETELDLTTRFQGVVIPADFDLQVLEVGAGYNRAINERWDFVGRLGYTDFDVGSFHFGGTAEDDFEFEDLDEDSSDGFLVDAGVRTQLAPQWEGGLGLRYRDLDTGDDVSAFGNIMWEFAPQWGLNFSADVGDDVRFLRAGVRWSY